MVVSSGFLDHAAEVYLRASDSIMSAQPIATSNRVGEWSQQLQQQQQTPSNQLTSQSTTIKVNPIPQQLARVILICQPNSHPFQVRVFMQFDHFNQIWLSCAVCFVGLFTFVNGYHIFAKFQNDLNEYVCSLQGVKRMHSSWAL